ncbi:MAG: DUF4160 domain-containing protein [Deltaproteobacteria bacterium]|nr:DUF4160 domain-containing protein [Deltaproteobacteria bacterium]
MGRIRRGGYIFEFWVGDHPPRHVHVLRNGKLLAKVELDEQLTVMMGKASRRIRRIIKALQQEGKL